MRICIWMSHWFLCASNDDWFAAVLNEIMQHSRRIRHSIGAVGDNEAVVVDYKYTKHPQYIKQNYQKQLDSYAQAVKQILKIDNVKKYILSLADGQIVEVMFHTEKEAVLSAELPPVLDMEVTYTEPGIKGDTASTSSLKPATVNTGATVKVPLFVNIGDKIRVDTRTGEYLSRA